MIAKDLASNLELGDKFSEDGGETWHRVCTIDHVSWGVLVTSYSGVNFDFGRGHEVLREAVQLTDHL